MPVIQTGPQAKDETHHFSSVEFDLGQIKPVLRSPALSLNSHFGIVGRGTNYVCLEFDQVLL